MGCSRLEERWSPNVLVVYIVSPELSVVADRQCARRDACIAVSEVPNRPNRAKRLKRMRSRYAPRAVKGVFFGRCGVVAQSARLSPVLRLERGRAAVATEPFASQGLPQTAAGTARPSPPPRRPPRKTALCRITSQRRRMLAARRGVGAVSTSTWHRSLRRNAPSPEWPGTGRSRRFLTMRPRRDPFPDRPGHERRPRRPTIRGQYRLVAV